MKKLHLAQDLLIGVLAVLTLFFALLSVLALIPADTDVVISETVTVSSDRWTPLGDPDTRYHVTASGVLRNRTDKELTVEKLIIPVDNNGGLNDPLELTMENIVIKPRDVMPFTTVPAESDKNCEYIGEITAIVNGEEIFLRNPADTDLSAVILPLLLTALAAFFLVWACKVRYYMAQEDRMDAK